MYVGLKGVKLCSGDDDDNYVPPTEQVHDIKEEGSVYSKR